MHKIGHILFFVLLMISFQELLGQSTVFNTPLAGCGGNDTIIYQSDWENRGDDGWKCVDFNTTPCGVTNNGYWQFGKPIPVASGATANNPAQGTDLCDFNNGTTATFTYPTLNGVDTMWCTNLDGCYANIQDSVRLYNVFDFSSLQAPIQFTVQHWYSGTGGDFSYIKVNERLMWSGNTPGGGRPWTNRTWTNDPFINSLAGNSGVIIEFGHRTNPPWNELGHYVTNVGIRGCKATGGGGPSTPVPTTSEWGLLFLTLSFLNFQLISFMLKSTQYGSGKSAEHQL